MDPTYDSDASEEGPDDGDDLSVRYSCTTLCTYSIVFEEPQVECNMSLFAEHYCMPMHTNVPLLPDKAFDI